MASRTTPCRSSTGSLIGSDPDVLRKGVIAAVL